MMKKKEYIKGLQLDTLEWYTHNFTMNFFLKFNWGKETDCDCCDMLHLPKLLNWGMNMYDEKG